MDNAWYASSGAWTSVTAWSLGASKVCGNIIRQATVSPANTERCFVCIASTGGTGTTGGTEPTWSTPTRGQKFTDNTVTWQECTGIAALNGDLTNTPSWTVVKNTAVTLGQVIKNVAGTLILICTTAGTAGNGSEPSWASFTNAGATTADNTVTWTTLGTSFTAWSAPSKTVFAVTTTNWAQAGNTVFVGDNSAETTASSSTYSFTNTSASTIANPIKILSVDHTAGVPPTSVLAGATVTTTGTGNLQTCNAAGGSAYYVNGISFVCGSGQGGSLSMFLGATTGFNVFDACKFTMASTGSGSKIQIGANAIPALYTKFYNTTFKFAAVGQALNINGVVDWINTPNAVDGAGSIPTTLMITSSSGQAMGTFRGVDFSALGSGKTILSGANGPVQFNFVDCKLGTSVTKLASLPSSSLVHFVLTDSGGTNYVTEKDNVFGTQTTETTIVRTGGALIFSQSVSWKIVTTSSSNWALPFASVPMQVSNSNIAQDVTVTVYGIWGGGAVPNNDDIWIEAEYLGASSSPLGSYINSSKASILAAGSAVSSDSSTWGGSTTAFKMSVTLSSPQPAQTGPINVRVLCAKPSTTFYIDPQPVLS